MSYLKCVVLIPATWEAEAGKLEIQVLLRLQSELRASQGNFEGPILHFKTTATTIKGLRVHSL